MLFLLVFLALFSIASAADFDEYALGGIILGVTWRLDPSVTVLKSLVSKAVSLMPLSLLGLLVLELL